MRTVQEAMPLAEASGDFSLQAQGLSSLGACNYFLGRPGAREIREKGLGLSRQGGDTQTVPIASASPRKKRETTSLSSVAISEILSLL